MLTCPKCNQTLRGLRKDGKVPRHHVRRAYRNQSSLGPCEVCPTSGTYQSQWQYPATQWRHWLEKESPEGVK